MAVKPLRNLIDHLINPVDQVSALLRHVPGHNMPLLGGFKRNMHVAHIRQLLLNQRGYFMGQPVRRFKVQVLLHL